VLRTLLLAWALLLACVPAQAGAASGLAMVDLTDDFDAFWRQTQSLDTPARVQAFYAEMEQRLPGFFRASRVGVEQARYDRHIADGLAAYPRQRDGIMAVSRRFAALFEPARVSFERAFGPLRMAQPVYLIHSLGEMDGGTRSLPGGTTLIFGADVIARLHLAHDIQPFFHHELFHVHHLARFGECQQIWCSLWIEGLATYVAKRLNPRATDAELLLEVPAPIRPAVEANRTEAICAVLARLDATGGADAEALFSFARLNERLPPRFGYYVGYLVAADLGRNRSLRALAQLPQRQVRPMIERSLRTMASCGRPRPGARR
jgi:hypothetical protein